MAGQGYHCTDLLMPLSDLLQCTLFYSLTIVADTEAEAGAEMALEVELETDLKADSGSDADLSQ